MSDASTRRATAGSSRSSTTLRSGSRNPPSSCSTAAGSPLRAPSSSRSVSSRLGHMPTFYNRAAGGHQNDPARGANRAAGRARAPHAARSEPPEGDGHAGVVAEDQLLLRQLL